jgi:hypothetical protein
MAVYNKFFLMIELGLVLGCSKKLLERRFRQRCPAEGERAGQVQIPDPESNVTIDGCHNCYVF